MADPGHIEQMILNLAINARDAMPTGGTLSIITSSREVNASEWSLLGAPAGSYICVQFSDNGTGMSADVRDRAFEPFFTTNPEAKGQDSVSQRSTESSCSRVVSSRSIPTRGLERASQSCFRSIPVRSNSVSAVRKST